MKDTDAGPTETFLQALHEADPGDVGVAKAIIHWANDGQLAAGYSEPPGKRQLRFRAAGRSVFCLNVRRDQPPDLNIELRWLRRANAFADPHKRNELTDRLAHNVSGWERPPVPPSGKLYGFPNVPLGRLKDSTRDRLLDELAWIVDHLLG